MCLIFFSLRQHSKYKLIIAANRDEFYERRTAAAAPWTDHENIIGGRDLEAGGTWMGISKKGRISLITNYRDLSRINPQAPSRGQLVSDFLLGDTSPKAYLENIALRANQYNGFNIIVGSFDDLWYFSNYRDGISQIDQGLHGLSNHLLETPWPKVQKGKQKLALLLKKDVITPEDLFSLLYDDQVATDDTLPDTGVGLDRERMLSAMFIKSPKYGTRCSTAVLVDYNNRILFTERVYDTNTFGYSDRTFTF